MSKLLVSSSTTSSSTTTYIGPLDFLDDQLCFDIIFPHPAPLSFSITSPTTVDHTSAVSLLNAYLDQQCLDIFIPTLHADYVGSDAINSQVFLQQTLNRLRCLTSSFRCPTANKFICLTPDDLYSQYLDIVPLLPSDTSQWGLQLPSQYFNSLMMDVQNHITTETKYLMPNPSTLSTHGSQMAALRLLRITAQTAHLKIAKCDHRVQKSIQTHMRARSGGGTPSDGRSGPTNLNFDYEDVATTEVTVAPPPIALTLPPPPSATVLTSPAEHTIAHYTPSAEPPVYPADPLQNSRANSRLDGPAALVVAPLIIISATAPRKRKAQLLKPSSNISGVTNHGRGNSMIAVPSLPLIAQKGNDPYQ